MSVETSRYRRVVAAYKRLKTIEKFNSLMVARGRLREVFFTTGLDYIDLTRKKLTFLKSGVLEEVVVHER